jgi:elongation factor 1-beta
MRKLDDRPVRPVQGSKRDVLLRGLQFPGAVKKPFCGVDFMGEVAIVYRIMPDGTDIDIPELASRVSEAARAVAKVQGMQEKPVAFGVTAILIRVIIEDKEGGPDEIEETLSGVEGVQSIEVLDMTRLI